MLDPVEMHGVEQLLVKPLYQTNNSLPDNVAITVAAGFDHKEERLSPGQEHKHTHLHTLELS